MKITHDDTTFTITGREWSGTYPLGELGKWLTFYRKQRQDFPKAGTTYEATVAGLEALAQKLGLYQDGTRKPRRGEALG
jgi:hypothetical protein